MVKFYILGLKNMSLFYITIKRGGQAELRNVTDVADIYICVIFLEYWGKSVFVGPEGY